MRQYGLYLGIKELIHDINCPYNKIYYNDRNEIEEGIAAIYIRSGILSKYRRIADAKFIGKYDRVQLIIQTGRTKEDILEGMRFGNRLEDELPAIFNKEITLDSNKIGFINGELSEVVNSNESEEDDTDTVVPAVLNIIRIDPQSGLVNMGKTEQGLTLFSINVIVNYSIYEAQQIT